MALIKKLRKAVRFCCPTSTELSTSLNLWIAVNIYTTYFVAEVFLKHDKLQIELSLLCSDPVLSLILQKREAPAGEKPEPVRTHLRNMIIVPEMIGSVIGVYNGKTFNQVEIKVMIVIGFILIL